MARKFTLQGIKNKLKEINPNIEIIADEYINKDAKLRCRCLIDGHEWDARWGHLTRGVGCPLCAGQIVTIDDIKKKLEIISPMVQILSKEYINAKGKIECKCLVNDCSNKWETTWMSLKQGSGCPKCGFLKIGNSSRLSLEEIKEKLGIISPSIELLSSEYLSSKTRLKCKCLIDNCNNEWEATWDSLGQGSRCPKCAILKRADKRRYSLDEVKVKIRDISPNIIIISGEYNDNTTKLKCLCTIDGHEWITIGASLMNGIGCPKCAIISRSGKNAYQWKGGISSLQQHLRSKASQWKKESIKSCKYKCVITGKPFEVVHHVYSFDFILQETLQIANLSYYQHTNQYTNEELILLADVCIELHKNYELGACLTWEMHYKFHESYGKGRNTLQQFEEFKNIMINKQSLI